MEDQYTKIIQNAPAYLVNPSAKSTCKALVKAHSIQSSLHTVPHFSMNIFKKCDMNVKMNDLKMMNLKLKRTETGRMFHSFVDRLIDSFLTMLFLVSTL
jgi:hypothetical protein